MSLSKQYLVDDTNGEQLLVEGASGFVTITDLSNGEWWQYTLEGATDLIEALDLAIQDAEGDDDEWVELGHTDAEDTLPGTFFTANIYNPGDKPIDQQELDAVDRVLAYFTD